MSKTEEKTEDLMRLLDQYKELLIEHEKVLNLSEMILSELKTTRSEREITILLEQREAAAKNISALTEKITSTQIKEGVSQNSKTLPEIKSLLEQIAEKTKLIQEVEEKIQSFLRDDRHRGK